ncbi:MAG: glycosyltransferase family 9 protein [Candidatus Omnitrophica bacterium]|nr:glycosyltransferase family 9 protein [Candidatus Omnitrophota bacterium]
MPKNYRNILVINTFGIGDVLFSTPLVRALKRNIPGATIDFMCNERCQYLMDSNPNINKIIVFEKDQYRNIFKKSKIGFVREVLKFAGRIRSARYDLAVDLSLGYQISLFLKLLGVKKRIGFNYRKRGRFLTDKLDIEGFNEKHAVEYYLDILRLISIRDVSARDIELRLNKEFDRWASGYLSKKELAGKRIIGLAPGGGRSWGKYAKYRRWSPDNFGYVANMIKADNENSFFLIFGSKEEKHLGNVIKAHLGDNSINLCGKLSLPQSISLIKKCELLLCNDGGLLHIAVSQKVKTVSIFGPVDDNVYGPYPSNDMHKVIKAEKVHCRPCYKSFKHTTCQSHDCLKDIDTNKVFKVIEEMLAKK